MPLALLLVGLMLAIPASASAAGFTAKLYAPNHSPRANRLWPVTVTAKRGRSELSGSVRYRFLYNGSIVAHKPGHSFKHGVYNDKLRFTSPAIGWPLTLQVVVTTKFGTDYLNWSVKTRA